MNPTRRPITPVRRTAAAVLAALWLTSLSLVLAAPAHADVPEGWPDGPSIGVLEVLGVLVGIPLLLALVITGLVYAPSLVRGERIAPGAPAVENQWLGGPRKKPGELAGPDSEESDAGGASGRW